MAKRNRKSVSKRMSYYGDVYVTARMRKRVGFVSDHEPTCEEVFDCLNGGSDSIEFEDCTDEEELEVLSVEKVDFNEPYEIEE